MAIKEFKETFDFEWTPEMIEVTQVPVTENVADIGHLQIDLNIRHAYECLKESDKGDDADNYDDKQEWIDNRFNDIIYMDQFSFVRPLAHHISIYCQENESDDTADDVVNAVYGGELNNDDPHYYSTEKDDTSVSVFISQHSYNICIIIPKQSKLFRKVLTADDKKNKILGITTSIDFACMSSKSSIVVPSETITLDAEDLFPSFTKPREFNISGYIADDFTFLGRECSKFTVALSAADTKMKWYHKHFSSKDAASSVKLHSIGSRKNLGEISTPINPISIEGPLGPVDEINISQLFIDPDSYRKGFSDMKFTIKFDAGIYGVDEPIYCDLLFFTGPVSKNVMFRYTFHSELAKPLTDKLIMLSLSTKFIFDATIDKEDWEGDAIYDIGNNEENTQS